DEDVAHGLIVGCRAGRCVAGRRGRKHLVELRDLEIAITDDRVVRGVTLRLLDVVRPSRMLVDRVDREADDLDAAFVELGLDLGHVAELGRANRGEILRMREQYAPGAADPLMKANASLRRVGFKIRRYVVESQGHGRCSCVVAWTGIGACRRWFWSTVRERLASSQDDRLAG